jgi:hypothetical protein
MRFWCTVALFDVRNDVCEKWNVRKRRKLGLHIYIWKAKKKKKKKKKKRGGKRTGGRRTRAMFARRRRLARLAGRVVFKEGGDE